ncbi:carbohydrate kinase family protein [Sanguibacter antarcticus]|uniref:Fructokinase n=1 Tax=Sanguibacter antarcticus TaxID=372484 RepID=A0A2A9E4M5_9MICO|nr:carbohydrate kinase [Sanguibacter antarcticus]PFG33804.1 fructokinase [Sanguibacter antarcticus]
MPKSRPLPTAPDLALVIGEALIDVVHRTDGSTSEHPGGSPANVALTLGRLERPVELLTWIGNDVYGDVVRKWLAGSSVSIAPGSDGASSTSLAVARLGADGGATYEFDLDWNLCRTAEVPEGTIVAHTGSIAAVLEPGATAVRRVLGSARSRATITYDPNIRPSLMGTATAVRPRVEELVGLSDVVKVSDEDLRWLYPAADLGSIATRWQKSGPALVVVTYGGEGAHAYTAGGRVDVAAPAVTVADTVGAGDSFMGALIDGLWSAGLLGASQRGALATISTETLTTVLEQCVQVAAITVSRPGANPPRRRELAL